MTKKVPELTEFQKEWVRKETAHYIFVSRDENGTHKCVCDGCLTEVKLGKTTHKDRVICPHCGKKMEICHEWRKKDLSELETIDWIVMPKVIDENTLMLRYVGAHRKGHWLDVFEAARIVFDTRQKTQHYFCFWVSGWEYTKRNYFIERSMYNYREWCCLPARAYRPTWDRELKKLACFKYYPDFMEHVNKFYYLSDGLKFMSYKAPLYEKLQKAGFDKLMEEDRAKDLRSFGVTYNTKETSLLKMLGLNRIQYKLLKDNQSFNSLEYIRLFPNITQEYLNTLRHSVLSVENIKDLRKHNISVDKVLAYFAKPQCLYYEWRHYVDILGKLDYVLDDSYLFPRDFRKEDLRVAKEYEEKCRKEREELEKNKNSIIANISSALRNNKKLMEFFAGSDGLQIFVPESAEDLRSEGKALHNCLGTYVDRVAQKKTLIFFIRRIEDPTAPYVAMEYCHGRVIQCHFTHNNPVRDEKIINFAQELAKRLAAQNILAA